MERTPLLNWLGILGGIGLVLAFVLSFVLTGDDTPPSPSTDSAALASYLVDKRGDAAIGSSLLLAGSFCFLWFVAYLREHLRQAEGDASWLSSVAYSGGLVAAGLMLVWSSLLIAARVLADYGTETQVAKTIYLLSWDFVLVLTPPLAALVLGSSLAGLLFAALPRWLSWLGVPIGLMLVVPFTAWFGFLLFFIWVLAVSAALVLRTKRVTHSVATT